MTQSAVQFATDRRVHIGLAVSNVDRSAAFYRTVFEAEPTKTRPGYARFEVAEPPLNLSLIQARQAGGPADSISHFGIQVQSTEAVFNVRNRLESAGLATRAEPSVACCHAVQDKVWVVDPDGHRWEVFVVLDDAPSAETNQDNQCCATTPGEPCYTAGGEPCCGEEG